MRSNSEDDDTTSDPEKEAESINRNYGSNFDFRKRMHRLRHCRPVEQLQGLSEEDTREKQFTLKSNVAAATNSKHTHNRHHEQCQSLRLTKDSLIVTMLATLLMLISTQSKTSIALPWVAKSIETRKNNFMNTNNEISNGKHRRRVAQDRPSSTLFDSPPELLTRNSNATNSTIIKKNTTSANLSMSSNFTTANDPMPEQIRHESNCYTPLLQSRQDEDLITTTFGIVFAIQNTNNESNGESKAITFDTMSVHLDKSRSANFTLYSLDGMYLYEKKFQEENVDDFFTVQENSVAQTSYLGQDLSGVPSGWQLLAEGLLDDYSKDEDGLAILPVSSFLDDGGITIDPGTVKSFFLNLSELVLVVGNVQEDEELEESVDDNVEIFDVALGLEVLIGRGVSCTQYSWLIWDGLWLV